MNNIVNLNNHNHTYNRITTASNTSSQVVTLQNNQTIQGNKTFVVSATTPQYTIDMNEILTTENICKLIKEMPDDEKSKLIYTCISHLFDKEIIENAETLLTINNDYTSILRNFMALLFKNK